MKPKVCFETKCWEEDWEFILKTNRLKEMIDRNQFNFDKKILMINNVTNSELVKSYAERAKKNKIIDEFYLVKNYTDKVLDFFQIDQSFKKDKGFIYSIAELTAIYLADCDFLVHFSSDSILEKKYPWVDQALKIFQQTDNIVVANPCWNRMYHEAKEESLEEKPRYYKGFGFSDQCYMIRINEFKKPIYNEYNPESARYPKYASELFEKRVDAWMRNHKKYRATLKNITYIHKNFPKNRLIKKFRLILESKKL